MLELHGTLLSARFHGMGEGVGEVVDGGWFQSVVERWSKARFRGVVDLGSLIVEWWVRACRGERKSWGGG